MFNNSEQQGSRNSRATIENSITLTPIGGSLDCQAGRGAVSTTSGGGTDMPLVTVSVVNNQASQSCKKEKKSARSHGARKPPPTLDNFWPIALEEVTAIQQVDARNQALPLARIKKIMKLDENAKMIAAEAPLLFAKACEYFIQELTMRAWIHTEENRRRTLQRSDIAQAIANYDQFDFLIDIVPREEIKPTLSTNLKRESNQAQESPSPATSETAGAVKMPPEVFTNVTQTQQPVPSLSNPQHQLHQQQQQQPVQLIQQTAIGANGQPVQYLIALTGQQAGQMAQLVQHPQQQQSAGQQVQLPNGLGLNIISQHAPTQQLIFATGPNGQITAIPTTQQPQQQQQQMSQQQHIQILQGGSTQQPK